MGRVGLGRKLTGGQPLGSVGLRRVREGRHSNVPLAQASARSPEQVSFEAVRDTEQCAHGWVR